MVTDGIIEHVEDDSARPRIAGFHHMGISVTDVDRSVRFYCDVLGADLLIAETSEAERLFPGHMAILGLGGRVLDLCQHEDNGGEPFDPVHTGLDHLALEIGSVDDLHAWASWIDSCGVTRSEIRKVAADLGTVFDLVDPDGIQIELIHLNFG